MLFSCIFIIFTFKQMLSTNWIFMSNEWGNVSEKKSVMMLRHTAGALYVIILLNFDNLLVLKLPTSEINIATLAFFWLWARYIFLHPLTFDLLKSLHL